MKKIEFLSILLAAVSILSVSCNKSDEDDPNVIYTSFNKTVIAARPSAIDSFDINLDTKSDFGIIAGKNAAGDTAAVYIIGIDNGGGYIDSTKNLGTIFEAVSLPKGQAPEKLGAASKWKKGFFIAAKFNADILGYAGAGDQFIPLLLRNPITGKIHYGWVRVNVSSDYVTFKLIDGAYNVVPDVPVKMGVR